MAFIWLILTFVLSLFFVETGINADGLCCLSMVIFITILALFGLAQQERLPDAVNVGLSVVLFILSVVFASTLFSAILGTGGGGNSGSGSSASDDYDGPSYPGCPGNMCGD